jgi:uncharacterized protein (DUF885 family)
VSDDINRLAAEYHDFRMRLGPTGAHLDGDYRFADRFEDVSRDAEDRDIAEGREFARRASAIPEDGLSRQDLISREMIAWDATARADIASSRGEEFGVDPIFGPQAMLPVVVPKLSLPSVEVADAMSGKYRGIATMFTDLAERNREGVAHARTPAEFAVRGTVGQLDAWLAQPLAEDPLLTPGEATGVADRAAWLAGLGGIVEGEVRPAVAAYRDVLRDEVLPAARPNEHPGLTWLADGAQTYERLIRFYTTLPLSAAEVHETGLRQIESLAAEYRTLGPEVVGSYDLARIFDGLRDDLALHHTNAEDIVTASKTAMAKAKAAMGEWFGIVPQADCGVEAITRGAAAYYYPPAADGSRGGVFFMNTSEPTGWGRFSIEATVYHEGIPGHHLQMAIATELTGVPEFRKRAFISAYGEGWALYTERLADEMGLYGSPLDRMGMLAADSLRATRLVVDTGMHALGWSRDDAVRYMLANSPMRESQVQAEVDRYIVNPGQALAYMIGRLEIQRMRADAETRLGDRFDIRAFHDTVLGSGLMPLPTLDRLVRDWVATSV